MPPAFNATIFGILGLIAAWAIRNNIRSGTASSRGWTCTIDDNPIGFCLIVSMKAVFVGLAIAEILHAFGLVDDPFVHITPETLAAVQSNPNITFLQTEHGGHCAFLSPRQPTAGDDGYWAEATLLRFILAHS